MGEDKDAFGKQNTEIHSHRDSWAYISIILLQS
jgi:hypothetical protein